MELLLDRYPGFTETIRPDDDGATIITVQNNHAQILSENAEMRKQHTQAPKGDQTWGNHVARIPMNDFEELRKEFDAKGPNAGGEKEFMAFILAKLRSNEFEKWKTFDGKV